MKNWEVVADIVHVPSRGVGRRWAAEDDCRGQGYESEVAALRVLPRGAGCLIRPSNFKYDYVSVSDSDCDRILNKIRDPLGPKI